MDRIVRDFVHTIMQYFDGMIDAYEVEDVISEIKKLLASCLTEQEKFTILQHEQQAQKTPRS